MGRFVHGVGINDYCGNVYIDGKEIFEYRLWKNILERCFCEKKKSKNKAYTNVTCSDDWLKLSDFIGDISNMVGYKEAKEGLFVLDKDILFKGNKIYSKKTCCFVPREINNTVISMRSKRGNLPIGVVYHKAVKKFQAQVNFEGNKFHIGYYEDATSAFYAYKEKKEALIKEMANKWKFIISEQVYEALLNWKIEIDD